MAKNWKPTLKQLSVYDELLKRQNIARKRLLKRRRIAEQETSFGRGLPDLVIPIKVKRYRDITRYRFNSYEDYRKKVSALQELYGGKGTPDLQYYKQTYKKNILNLIKGWIQDYIGYREKPEGYFGKYSDEQIQKAYIAIEDGGKFLNLFNKMQSLSTGEFMTMYDFGYIPRIKYIYNEMSGKGVQLNIVDEFLDSFKDYRRQARNKTNVTVTTVEERKEILEKQGKSETGKFKK